MSREALGGNGGRGNIAVEPHAPDRVLPASQSFGGPTMGPPKAQAAGPRSAVAPQPRPLFRRQVRWLLVLGVIGPGLMVMLADTDAGSIVTAAQSGARWGYRLLPLEILLMPVLYLVMELSPGLCRGNGLQPSPPGGAPHVGAAHAAARATQTYATADRADQHRRREGRRRGSACGHRLWGSSISGIVLSSGLNAIGLP